MYPPTPFWFNMIHSNRSTLVQTQVMIESPSEWQKYICPSRGRRWAKGGESMRWHSADNHKPSKVKTNTDLASTLHAHRAAEDARFINKWLLKPLPRWVILSLTRERRDEQSGQIRIGNVSLSLRHNGMSWQTIGIRDTISKTHHECIQTIRRIMQETVLNAVCTQWCIVTTRRAVHSRSTLFTGIQNVWSAKRFPCMLELNAGANRNLCFATNSIPELNTLLICDSMFCYLIFYA